MPIQHKAQRIGAHPHSFQMAVEQRHPLFGIEQHCFDQIKTARVSDKAPLGETLGPFLIHLAIRHNAAAQTQRCDCRVLWQMQCPDRDIERRIAIGINAADAARINAARLWLDIADNFHRPDLGRARNRPAGVNGAQKIRHRLAGFQLRRHG